MLNLFQRRQLLQLPAQSSPLGEQPVNIQLATYGTVQSPSSGIQARLVLYCSDYRLLLVQFPAVDNAHTAPQQLWIPTDQRKGPIIALALNAAATSLLALTSQSYLYLIPFTFTLEPLPHSSLQRAVLTRDATVLRCLALRSPSSLAWWERSHAASRQNIALVGNTFGQLVFVDLETSIEFKLFTFQFGIESLAIFDELYSQTLLISCSNRFQYQLVLEQFRSIIGLPPRKKSTTSSIGSLALWSCGLSAPYGAADLEEDDGLMQSSMASVLDSPDIKPQLVSIHEESTASPSATVSSQSEFFDLLEDSLKMSLHPQRQTRSIFVVKQHRPKYDFAGTASITSLRDPDVLSASSALSSDGSDLSAAGFCSVALDLDLTLDVHEFRAEDFSSKCIVLRDSKLFLVTIESIEEPKGHKKLTKRNLDTTCDLLPTGHHQLLKIIDCGHRFFLLVYPTRVALVSKYFSEQRNHHSANSPRSPLLLKKSDSLRSSASGGGSFRRKHYNHSTSGGPSSGGGTSSAVIEDFKATTEEEEIVNVFLLSTPAASEPDFTSLIHRDYPLASSSSVGTIDLDSILRSEKAAIETKLSPKILELVRIDEHFLVVTRTGCYMIKSEETAFGDYFHREIIQQLERVDGGVDGAPVEGDVITRAKYLVDCFVFRHNSRTGPLSASVTAHPAQSWQFWLTRSALLLMQQLATSLAPRAEPQLTEAVLARFNLIFRLFELARTPRRRVITSLMYFGFWSRALYYIRKFFETRVLQELTDEERLFLAHQMLECLLERYRRADGAEAKKEAETELFGYFRGYRAYYDIGRTLERLVDCGLWKMARFAALLQAEYLILLQILLKKFSSTLPSLPKVSRTAVLDLLTSHRLAYTLLLSTRYLPAAESPSSPAPAPATSIRLLESFLDLLLKSLPSLTSTELHRLVGVLEPTSFPMQLLLNNVLDLCNQTYLRDAGSCLHVLESYLPIRKRDLLNLYVFVLLLALRKTQLHHRKKQDHQATRLYDWHFLANVTAALEEGRGATDQQSTTVAQTSDDSVYCVSAGTFHSVAFESARTNQLFVWGKFPFVPGPLPSPGRHLRSPVAVDFFAALLPKVVIREVACGHLHTMVLTDLGLFTFGSSSFGQLGLGEQVLESRYPMVVDRFQAGADVKAVKIAAGSYHSLAISEDGELYSWGWALHGQLGHGTIDDEWTPRRVEAWDYQKVKIVAVAAGYAHTVVLTSTGDLYVFGENSYSQLGLEMDSTADEPTPGKVKVNRPFRLPSTGKFGPGTIRLIACGLFHTMVIIEDESDETSRQRLFCWGLDPKTWRVKMRANRSGKAKEGEGSAGAVYEYAKLRQINLEKVSPGGRVVKMVGGQSHSVLLTDQGRVYTVGFGREGQLGLGSGIPSSPLVAEPILELEAIVDVAAGAAHSLAVNTEGTVWGWGQNADFQLDSTPSVLEGSGSGSATDSRRSSLLNSLMRRGDDQLMSRLMSLQKNVEWIPIRVCVPLAVKGNRKVSGPLPEPIDIGRRTWTRTNSKNRSAVLKQLLIDCLVRYRQLLDFRAIRKRFNQFDYPQLSAIVSYLLDEPVPTYLYQLAALKQEIQLELEAETQNDASELSTQIAKWTEQLYSLTVFFVTRDRLPPEEIYQMLSGLFDFWLAVRVILAQASLPTDHWSLKQLLTRLYLDGPISSPYFGLAFLRLLQERDQQGSDDGGNIRQQLGLDDVCLLELLQRTQATVGPTEMVAIQQLLERLVVVDGKQHQTARCDCSGDGAQSNAFPLEHLWRKILRQFEDSTTARRPPREASKEPEEQIDDQMEVTLPSDFEKDEEEEADKENQPLLLFVFKCGHCLTRSQLLQATSGRPQSPALSALLEASTTTTVSSLIEDLLCPQCSPVQQTAQQ